MISNASYYLNRNKEFLSCLYLGRVKGSADRRIWPKISVRIADFNNNFSGSVDPINVVDSDLGKNIVRITDSKHNCSQSPDLSMAASTDLALTLRGSADPVPPFHPPYLQILYSAQSGSESRFRIKCFSFLGRPLLHIMVCSIASFVLYCAIVGE